MKWRIEPAREAFESCRRTWDSLNASTEDNVLLDAEFVQAAIHHFGDAGTRLAICDDPGGGGLALLRKTRFGLWQTFQPSQAPIGLLVLGHREGAHDALERLIADLPGHALGVSILQQDPDHTAVGSIKPSPRVERIPYIDTARITISGSFEDYWKSRSRNLKHNVARQRRKLAARGDTLEMSTVRDVRRVAEAVREYASIEAAGWKAQIASAVTPGSRQESFYKEVLERFCEREQGAIYRLQLNGKTIACDLCVEKDDTVVLLKTTYDERVKGYSPGLLLHEEIVKSAYAADTVRVLECYGRVLEWHKKFTQDVRTMYHLNLFRYGWVAEARRRLKRLVSSPNVARQGRE